MHLASHHNRRRSISKGSYQSSQAPPQSSHQIQLATNNITIANNNSSISYTNNSEYVSANGDSGGGGGAQRSFIGNSNSNEIDLNLSSTAGQNARMESPSFSRKQAATASSALGSHNSNSKYNNSNNQNRSHSSNQHRNKSSKQATAVDNQQTKTLPTAFDQPFGFIKKEQLLGGGTGGGIRSEGGAFSSEIYKACISRFAKERNSISSVIPPPVSSYLRPRCQSVLAVMEQHIEITNRLQRRFLEDSAISAAAAAASVVHGTSSLSKSLHTSKNSNSASKNSSYIESNTTNSTSDDTAVILKLRKHLGYQRERKEIDNLMKEAMLKSNFNPNDDSLDLSMVLPTQTQESSSIAGDQNKYSSSAQKQSEFQQLFKPKSKQQQQSKQKQQLPVDSSLASSPVSPKKMQLKSSKMTRSIELGAANQQRSVLEEDEEQIEGNADDAQQTGAIPVAAFLSSSPGLKDVGVAVAAAAAKKKDTHNILVQNEVNVRKLISDKQHRAKINAIMLDHAKNIKEIEFVYSDITEESKKLELAERQKRLEQLQQQYLLKKSTAAADPQSSISANGSVNQVKGQESNAKSNWKNLTGLVRTNVRSLTSAGNVVAAASVANRQGIVSPSTQFQQPQQQQQQQQRRTSNTSSLFEESNAIGSSNSNNNKKTIEKNGSKKDGFAVVCNGNSSAPGPVAAGGVLKSQSSVNSIGGWEKLEQQRQDAIEQKQRTEDDCKLFFEPEHRARMKELQIDLSREGTKEAVLDRVMMNYFHQEDLLKQQRELLRKSAVPKRIKELRQLNSSAAAVFAAKGGTAAASSQSAGTSGTSSTSQGRSSSSNNNNPINAMLKQFNPAQLRLKLNDLKVQNNSKNKRSNPMRRSCGSSAASSYTGTISGSNNNNNRSFEYGYTPNNESNYLNEQLQALEDANIDVNLYKEKCEWKKRQNQVINYSKVCSPVLMVMQFMQDDPAYKKQANIEIIDYLVSLDPTKSILELDEQMNAGSSSRVGEAPPSTSFRDSSKPTPSNGGRFKENSLGSSNIEDGGGGAGGSARRNFGKNSKAAEAAMNQVLRRCFFRFSNKNDPSADTRFQEINYEGFLALFNVISGKDSPSNSIGANSNSAQIQNKLNATNNNNNSNVNQQQQDVVDASQNNVDAKTAARLQKEQLKKQREMEVLLAEQKYQEDRQKSMKQLREYLPNEVVKGIYEKLTKGQSKPVLSYFLFLQAFRRASLIYYMSIANQFNESEVLKKDSEAKKNSDELEGESESNEEIRMQQSILHPKQAEDFFSRFYYEFIEPIERSKFRDAQEQELLRWRSESGAVDALLRGFEVKLYDLFVFAGSMRSSNAHFEPSQIYLSFQDFFDLFAKLELFPDKISKTSVRYVYGYALLNEKGLQYEDFCVSFHLIALTIIRAFQLNNAKKQAAAAAAHAFQNAGPKDSNSHSYHHAKQSFNEPKEIEFTLSKLKGTHKSNVEITKFVTDISLFYLQKEFIDINNLSKRIFTIKEALHKQLQF